jgi:nitrogenase-associated protein
LLTHAHFAIIPSQRGDEDKTMADVIFYELPGCPANEKQKKTLRAAGHQLIERDLSAEAWTPATLRPFFGEAAVEDWFNRTHPDIRSGKIDRATLSEEQALALLIAHPDLIRRPLIQVGETLSFGYDPNRLQAWIGIQPSADGLSCDDRHSQGRCDHGRL